MPFLSGLHWGANFLFSSLLLQGHPEADLFPPLFFKRAIFLSYFFEVLSVWKFCATEGLTVDNQFLRLLVIRRELMECLIFFTNCLGSCTRFYIFKYIYIYLSSVIQDLGMAYWKQIKLNWTWQAYLPVARRKSEKPAGPYVSFSV